MSGKIVAQINEDGPKKESRDLAKYFVPAWTIAKFVPPEYRFW
jgi:hypothetical protein